MRIGTSMTAAHSSCLTRRDVRLNSKLAIDPLGRHDGVTRFPIPDSRFPIPDSRFPIPDSRFPIPDSRFPMPDVRILPATIHDVPTILALIKSLAEYERLGHEVVATEDVLRRSLFGARPEAEVVLAYVGSDVAGFALFFHNFSTFLGRHGLYLEDLYVLPEHRAKGIGRRLLQYLAHLALERECGRLEWWVLDWNEVAIRFYQSIGAVPMSDWTVYRVAGDALTALAVPTPPDSSPAA
jgi:GNAT superfamily N-acetyltransferase